MAKSGLRRVRIARNAASLNAFVSAAVAEETRSRLGATEVLFLAQQLLMNEVEWPYESWDLQAGHCGKVLSLR
jgi:hypothetical protein